MYTITTDEAVSYMQSAGGDSNYCHGVHINLGGNFLNFEIYNGGPQ
jgi:hypothetical protein